MSQSEENSSQTLLIIPPQDPTSSLAWPIVQPEPRRHGLKALAQHEALEASPNTPQDPTSSLARPTVQSEPQRRSLEALLDTISPARSAVCPELQHESPETLPKTSSLTELPVALEPQHEILEASPKTPLVSPTVLEFLEPHVQNPEDSTNTPDTTNSQKGRDKDILASIREKWHNYKDARPRHHPIVKSILFLLNISPHTYKFIVICTLITIVTIATSMGLAFPLARPPREEFDLHFPPGPFIWLSMRPIAVDPILGTLDLEWHPYFEGDPGPSETYCVYFDPNSSAISNPNEADTTNPAVASNSKSQKATFCFSDPANDGFSARFPWGNILGSFRTTSKLGESIGFVNSPSTKSMELAYPFDAYPAAISMVAFRGVKRFNDTTSEIANATAVNIKLTVVPSAVIGFEVQLNPDSLKHQSEGVLLLDFNISRSVALQLYVVLIVLANWLITLVFLWITMACAFWNEKVVKEMFVVPISVLFTFTAVRSSMPGVPPAFGAFIDFVGFLPNMVVLTICSSALLIIVTFCRIKNLHKDDNMKNIVPQAMHCCCDRPTTHLKLCQFEFGDGRIGSFLGAAFYDKVFVTSLLCYLFVHIFLAR